MVKINKKQGGVKMNIKKYTKIFACDTAITWARVLASGDVEIKNDYWYGPTKKHTMTKKRFITWINDCNKPEIFEGILN